MKEELKNLLSNSYAPYSNYRVSAILETKDGAIFKGVNVENASYGATICAERNAILSAITCGYQKGDFKRLSVMVDSDNKAYPCFICRQVIEEFFTGEEELVLYTLTDEFHEQIKDIIVKPFNKENLQ